MFVAFAEGLERDRAAVEAALTYAWRSGLVEGQITKLKLQKRESFGRANSELLKRWVLRATERPSSKTPLSPNQTIKLSYHLGWKAVLLQVTVTFCAIMVVALIAHDLGRPDLRPSPTRVFASYLPVEQPL